MSGSRGIDFRQIESVQSLRSFDLSDPSIAATFGSELAQWRKRAPYPTFADLSSREAPNAYSIYYRRRQSAIAVMAPHGGTLEPGTSEIAQLIAGSKHSYYTFNSRLPKEDAHRLHITSERFDEPQALAIARSAKMVITVHGFSFESAQIYVGGGSVDLRESLTEQLCRAGVPASYSALFPGVATNNICNRGESKGVQLEIPPSLRTFQRVGGQIVIPRPVVQLVKAVRGFLDQCERSLACN